MQFTDIIVLALRALSERCILLIAMFMAGGLFAWAMTVGTTLALWTAASFAVLVFLPTLIRGTNGKQATNDSVPERTE